MANAVGPAFTGGFESFVVNDETNEQYTILYLPDRNNEELQRLAHLAGDPEAAPGPLLDDFAKLLDEAPEFAEGYNQRFLLWNASVSKQFLRTRQAEVRLQVFDLLNQNRSLVRNTGDAYIEDVRSRVLKRYFLISLVYNLRKFGV